MSKICVIVPVYNVESYIHRCVKSILNQSYKDFELILVDDGSPDNCPAICDEYAQKDNRVVVIHQKNGGLSAARNAGIDWAFANSNSEWLTFIDSDDWIHPEFLQSLINAALSFHTQVAVSGLCYPDSDQVSFDMPAAPVLHAPEELYCLNNHASVSSWCKLYRKELFNTIRYPVGKLHEDMYTTYRILFPCDRIAYIETPMYCYFQSPASITRSTWSPKRLDAIEAHEEAITFFQENGYKRPLNLQLIMYIRSLASNVWEIRQSDHSHEYQNTDRELTKN